MVKQLKAKIYRLDLKSKTLLFTMYKRPTLNRKVKGKRMEKYTIQTEVENRYSCINLRQCRLHEKVV